MSDYTWLQGLGGGILIGVAALILMAGIGRIAGISGIVANSVQQRFRRGWHVAFVLGLVVSGLIWQYIYGKTPLQLPSQEGWLLLAGLLVGYGTQLGSGCTSGHGVCGTARLSRRSMLATAVFMASGILTVYLKSFS